MRSVARGMAVTFFCLLLFGFDQLPRRAPDIPRLAVVNSPKHATFSLKSLRGHVVLVFFWNEKDAPFDDFINTLKRWYAEFRSRDLDMAAVYIPWWDSENSGVALPDLITRYALEFPVMIDRGARVRAAYNELMSPAVFCIDRKGFIRAEYFGIIDMKSVRIMLETLLEEAP